MNPQPIEADQALRELRGFDAVLDVRSPGEFALDHLPGAANWWVLDDAERARVGTLYKQQGSFEAKRVGAALVARNIALHIESGAGGWPRRQRVLAYCWRGGNRSGAMAHVLAQIGFPVALVRGGYKALRSALVAQLDAFARAQRLIVLCGPTGCGKSRLLQALHARGAQVLDLERLAAHRGSVLGGMAAEPQPTQKAFETRIWETLRAFDPARPTFVESESRKIGRLQVPPVLIEHMRAAECLRLQAELEVRVQVLLGDYADMISDPAELQRRLQALRELRGAQAVQRWQRMSAEGEFAALTRELLEQHYDPSYEASMRRNYQGFAEGKVWEVESAGAFDAMAARLREVHDPA
ncbi:MAG: tRNA 2-selenouridine(34) synthase MnmH [Betaproteobacteria bacterium]|nr:tRNA 2-selenouridine(34) synthase MnmH [Betaproteobacteria bacterium]MBU6512708.1 tRNA 2-selenouridine(34) synthase MnmH [Betaproteobacteria bacterium]MDE2152487.1 tRNA 2-selenouridine(34) synthase MnmH [Betaproteobacteria bacterium]